MSKVIFECSKCKAELKANGNSSLMDGLNCPICRGHLILKHNDDNDIVTYALYICLTCEHKSRLYGRRKDYTEVTVCPKCNGAFVDRYKIDKYKNAGIDFASGKDYTVTNYYKGAGNMYAQRLLEGRIHRLSNAEERLLESIKESEKHIQSEKDELQRVREERRELNELKEKL